MEQISFFQHVQGTLRSHVSSSTLVRTVGEIDVRPSERKSRPTISIDLKIYGSHPRLIDAEALSIGMTGSSLTVETPLWMLMDSQSFTANTSPCIYIDAAISISAGAALETLRIDSESLSVTFQPGLDYAPSECTKLSPGLISNPTVAEKAPVTSLYHRETRINLNSGSVKGFYPLYDLLSIHTVSGSVEVNVDPRKASKNNVKPAVLRLDSSSGSIRATTPTVNIPDRDYQTSISSDNGGIESTLLHGLRTSIHSINGHIRTDLYPYGHNNSRTDIDMHSSSGNTEITLHSSLSHPAVPLKKLYSKYHTVSGNLRLWYPAQWQGMVEGTTSSGSVRLDWKGLKVVKDEKKGWAKRNIEAVRGDGEGKLIFSQVSGIVELTGESGGISETRRRGSMDLPARS